MTSMPKSNESAPKSRLSTILLTGLLIGVVTGVVLFSISVWTFSNLIPGVIPSSTNVESTESDNSTSELDRIFTSKFSHSDLFALTETLSTLNQHDLKELIKKSSNHPLNARLYTVQEMLVEFLVQISPKEAIASLADFDKHRRLALLRDVFTYWSLSNLELALATATELPQSEQRTVLQSIFVEHNSRSSEDLLSISNRLNLETTFVTWQRKREAYEILDEEPAEAFDLLTNDEVDDLQQIDLYRQIMDQWFQFDGLDIIPQIGNASLDYGLWRELFNFVTEQDRTAALNFLFEESKQDSPSGLVYELINKWVEDNAVEAFQAVNDLPNSQFRNSLMQSLTIDWAQAEPNVVLERLIEVPRFFRTRVLSIASAQLANDNPKDALDRISSFRTFPGTNVDRATRSVIRRWSYDEPKQTLEWVQTNVKEGTVFRTELLNEVLPKYALEEPEQAMSIAIQEFNSDTYFNLESRVISSLLSANKLDTAKELLDQVREEIRLSQTIDVAVEFAKKNRIDEVLALSSSIPDEEKSEYFYRLASLLTIYDRASEIMDVISKISTAELQSDVAERLLNTGYGDSTFTTEHIETLKSYLSE